MFHKINFNTMFVEYIHSFGDSPILKLYSVTKVSF